MLNKEFLFKKVAFSSATLILLILTSIFVMLFIYAKPAINEYGLNFLTDASWNKSVVIHNSTQNTLQAQQNKIDDDENDGSLFSDDNSILDEESDDISKNEDNIITKTIFGGYIPIVGTILSSLIAMVFAIPIALGIAVFLSEIAPDFLIKPVGIAIELLAAIPSIIYGMWGLFYFAPILKIFLLVLKCHF